MLAKVELSIISYLLSKKMAAILTDSGHRQKYKNFNCTKYLAATLTGGTQWPVFPFCQQS